MKKFGWKARSEGVFTNTVNYRSLYGHPYLFFPEGNFKFIWSPYAWDLFSFNFLTFPIEVGVNKKDRNLTSDEIMTLKYKLLKKDLSFTKEMKCLEALDIILDTYKDTDLDAAMKTRNEIVFKCDYYYMVDDSEKHIREIINK